MWTICWTDGLRFAVAPVVVVVLFVVVLAGFDVIYVWYFFSFSVGCFIGVVSCAEMGPPPASSNLASTWLGPVVRVLENDGLIGGGLLCGSSGDGCRCVRVKAPAGRCR